MIQNVHSIHNQPSVYNQGGSGGGGAPKIGGWGYEGIFSHPSNSVASGSNSSNLFCYDLKENCFYRTKKITSNYDGFNNAQCPRYYRSGGIIKREDDLEISIDFKLNNFGSSTGASVILSGSTSIYNTQGSISIDMNRESHNIVFLMANSDGWGNTGNAISVFSDKIDLDYLTTHICNVRVKHYANTDDFEIWFEGEQSSGSRKTFTSPLYGGTCDHVLGGIYNHLNSISNNHGKVYFSSYVKYNGVYLTP